MKVFFCPLFISRILKISVDFSGLKTRRWGGSFLETFAKITGSFSRQALILTFTRFFKSHDCLKG
jgi:hypothetical protein